MKINNIKSFRKKDQRLLQDFTNRLIAQRLVVLLKVTWVRPNHVTFISLIAGLTAAYLITTDLPRLAPGLPKLLEKVEGVPVPHHVINASLGMSRINGDQSRITVVISDRFADLLQESLNESFPKIRIAVQENHLGTADAVWQAIFQNQYPDCQSVFVLMGDQPLITSQDLDAFHRFFVDDPLVGEGILAFEEYRQKPEFQKCGKVFFNGDGKFDRIETAVQSGAQRNCFTRDRISSKPHGFVARSRCSIRMSTTILKKSFISMMLFVARSTTRALVCASARFPSISLESTPRARFRKCANE